MLLFENKKGAYASKLSPLFYPIEIQFNKIALVVEQ